MAERPPNHDAWTLDGSWAASLRGELAARVDVSRPDLGLRQIRLGSRDLPGHLLAVRRDAEDASPKASCGWPLALADTYVRGGDLVASYQASDDWPYSPQLYWNASPLKGVDNLLDSLSMLIAVETHLLDTWPQISIGSKLPCQELLHVNPATGAAERTQPGQLHHPSSSTCCVLHRFAETPISYVEIMPASDFRKLTVLREVDGTYRVEWRLFADFLEKGVIRKARLQSAFVPRERDVQLALECREATMRCRLPLTT